MLVGQVVAKQHTANTSSALSDCVCSDDKRGTSRNVNLSPWMNRTSWGVRESTRANWNHQTRQAQPEAEQRINRHRTSFSELPKHHDLSVSQYYCI